MMTCRMPARLVPARNVHFQYLADHLRPDEQAHWCAMSGAAQYDPEVAARGFVNTPGIKLAILGADGLPVVGGGVHRVRGQTYEAWMVGTLDGWASDWRAITRGVRWMVGEQFKAGAQRVQIITLESRSAACAWYERALGMHRESVIEKAGAHGENLVMYAVIAGTHR
jgi:hypothetical protein